MINICCITTPSSAATDYYRTVTPLQWLSRELPDRLHVEAHEPDRLKWYHLAKSDVVVLCRPNGSHYLGIMAEAKKMKKKIWADYDDDLLNITDANPASKHFNKEKVKQTVIQAVAMADVVTTSTQELAQLYQALTRHRIHVIPNAYNHYERPFIEYRPQDKPVKMFWRGSATHLYDLHTIKDVVNSISKSKSCNLSILGLERWMLPFIDGDYKLSYWKTLYAYLNDLEVDRPDWFLVPLVDDPFNRGKSNIAWIEATTAGAAVLAPAGLSEWIRPGIVNYRSPEHLLELVGEISTGKRKKSKYVEQSRTWIDEYLRLDRVNQARVQVIDALMKPEALIKKLETAKP